MSDEKDVHAFSDDSIADRDNEPGSDELFHNCGHEWVFSVYIPILFVHED